MTDAEVMAQFESLGSNCEFGIAQRMAGIEPFGLFRFAATPSELLIRLLTAKFDGLGGDIEMWNRDGEWMTRDCAYDWSMHTWTRVSEIDHDAILAREAKRLAYLRDRMLDLLAEGSRTFVVVGCDTTDAETVFDLLQSYGSNRLLHVTEGDEAVATIRSGLFRGTVPRFADWRMVDRDTNGAAWARLCRKVHQQCVTMPPMLAKLDVGVPEHVTPAVEATL